MSQAPGRLAGRRVLIVEDHEDSRDIMRQCLEHEGAAVIEAASAHTAIMALYAATVDIVLTDVSLRGSAHDGPWLLREIRGAERLARIPVIAITGHKERAAELRQLGFADVLVKPIEATELGAIIQRCLGAQRGG